MDSLINYDRIWLLLTWHLKNGWDRGTLHGINVVPLQYFTICVIWTWGLKREKERAKEVIGVFGMNSGPMSAPRRWRPIHLSQHLSWAFITSGRWWGASSLCNYLIIITPLSIMCSGLAQNLVGRHATPGGWYRADFEKGYSVANYYHQESLSHSNSNVSLTHRREQRKIPLNHDQVAAKSYARRYTA